MTTKSLISFPQSAQKQRTLPPQQPPTHHPNRCLCCHIPSPRAHQALASCQQRHPTETAPSRQHRLLAPPLPHKETAACAPSTATRRWAEAPAIQSHIKSSTSLRSTVALRLRPLARLPRLRRPARTTATHRTLAGPHVVRRGCGRRADLSSCLGYSGSYLACTTVHLNPYLAGLCRAAAWQTSSRREAG
jgi:hypothetical protein